MRRTVRIRDLFGQDSAEARGLSLGEESWKEVEKDMGREESVVEGDGRWLGGLVRERLMRGRSNEAGRREERGGRDVQYFRA